MSKSYHFGDLLEQIGKVKIKHLVPQAVMLHPRALGRVRTVFDRDEKPSTYPFGIRIHTADWLDPDEYFLGNEKTVRAILTIAEDYGPEIAKIVLQKLLEISAATQKPESPQNLQKTT